MILINDLYLSLFKPLPLFRVYDQPYLSVSTGECRIVRLHLCIINRVGNIEIFCGN